MPYTKFHNPWANADSSSGGGDESTPITAAALDWIEAGIATAQLAAENADPSSSTVWAAKGDLLKGVANDSADILSVGAQNEVLTVAAASALDWTKIVDAHIDAAANIARSKLATQTRRVPANLHTPATAVSAGNAFWSVIAQTNYDMGHWQFVKDVNGKAYGQVLVPSALAATGGSLILHIAANATTGVTRLSVHTKAVADGESLNPTFTAETAQDITVPGTAYLRKDVTFTLTEALAAGDLLIFQVYHEGAHANDTLAVNTLLLGASLEVTVN